MNEIQYVPIDDCVKVITAPKKLNRSCYLENGLFPIVDQGQEFIAGYTNDEDAIVQNDEYVIFGDHTREIKYVDFAFAQGADGVKIIKTKSNLLPRYFYHSLKNVDIPNRGYNRHWSIVKDIQIPLPPLSIQQRIVEILDKFTSLVSHWIPKSLCVRSNMSTIATNSFRLRKGNLNGKRYLKLVLIVTDRENRLQALKEPLEDTHIMEHLVL